VRNRLDAAVNVALVCACLLVGANAGLNVWGRMHPGQAPRAAGPQNAAKRPDAPPLPTEPISIADRLAVGNQKAPVVVIEYSDYQCPFCERFERNTFTTLNDVYVKQGRVRWIYRHLPLESIHASAFTSAEAAECAAAQGRFAEYHRLLSRNRARLDPSSLSRYAQEADLDGSAFAECMKGDASGKVRADVQSASTFGINGTPSFLLGTLEADGRVRLRERLVGAVSLAEFQASIDKILSTGATPSAPN